jgi:adenylate cyclase
MSRWCISACFGLVLMGFLYRRSAITGTIVLIAAVAVTIGASWWQFAEKGYLFDPIYPGLAAIAMFGTGTLVNYLRVEREKEVRATGVRPLSLTGSCRSSQQGSQAAEAGWRVARAHVDVLRHPWLHQDFRITRSPAAHPADELVPDTDDAVIQDHEGTIDKYIGDCIMAFWNAPLDVPIMREGDPGGARLCALA